MQLAAAARAEAGLKVALWLLTMAIGLGLLIWLLPPRAIERRLLEAEQPKPTLFRDRMPEPKPSASSVICPVAPPCWKDGKPITGAL